MNTKNIPISSLLLGGAAVLTNAISACTGAPASTDSRQYNIILIAIDDLNDWVGSFGGNPQGRTPNMDKLCQQGAVTFQNAYCPGPISGPSRSALLSGFMPQRSGVYSNSENMRYSTLVQTYATLPEYFAKNGYVTISRGKIFHKHNTPDGTDHGQWAYTEWSNTNGGFPLNKERLYSRNQNIYDGKKEDAVKEKSSSNDGDGTEFSWGPTTENKENTTDYKTAQWAAAEIAKQHDQPWFLAVGISKPHLPWYVPQEYFDRHPLETIKIPEHRLDDLDDILTPEGKKKFAPSADFNWVNSREGLWQRAVQAYLASASYADDCVGVILDALEKSPERDNTIVIIFGDHGWHLGEKLRFRKATLWQEATRLPLIIRVPGITKERADCMRMVNLIDLYPTLIDLCGLPAKPEIDGRSIAPLLRNPQKAWDYPNVTILGQGNASVRDENWYLIRYNDGTEEFYDMTADPYQWTNLTTSKDAKALAAKAKLMKSVPKEFATPIANLLKKQTEKGEPALPNANEKRDLSKLK